MLRLLSLLRGSVITFLSNRTDLLCLACMMIEQRMYVASNITHLLFFRTMTWWTVWFPIIIIRTRLAYCLWYIYIYLFDYCCLPPWIGRFSRFHTAERIGLRDTMVYAAWSSDLVSHISSFLVLPFTGWLFGHASPQRFAPGLLGIGEFACRLRSVFDLVSRAGESFLFSVMYIHWIVCSAICLLTYFLQYARRY